MMTYSQLWYSLSAKQRKELGVRLRTRVNEFVDSIGGTVATAKFHNQNGYGEGFVCCYCVDRRINRIRVYHNGHCYAFNDKGDILFRDFKEEWNELSTPANV